MKIINKHIYGGMLVDKYYFILEDKRVVQVNSQEYDKYNVGDDYKLKKDLTPRKNCANIQDEHGRITRKKSSKTFSYSISF